VFKLLSLFGIVGNTSINAQIAPRIAKITTTNGSPEEENCCEAFVVVPLLIRLDELILSSSKFSSEGL
jgi:hypothetical protein